MKRKLPILGVIALCMVVVGMGICVLALGLGARTSVGMDEVFSFKGRLNAIQEDEIFSSFENIDNNTSGLVKREDTLSSFENIDVEVGTLEVEIKESDHYGIEIYHTKRTGVTYKVVGDTLRVEQKGYKNLINLGPLNFDGDIGNQGKVTIFIPEAALVENITLNEGVGSKSIENITVGELDLKAGVGDTELTNVQIDKATIITGVGDVTASELSCLDLKITGGVGDIELQGTFGDLDIVGGVGSVAIETDRKESAYDYKITRGLGDVEVNNKSSMGFGNIEQDNGSDYTIKVKGGIGDIEIYTAE